MGLMVKSFRKDGTLIDIKRLLISLVSLLIATALLAVTAYGQGADPMQDKYSKEIRAEYSKCRDLISPISQFFCACRVLEKQCEGPRKLDHGNWNIVEFWPSDEEAEREVQFVLFLEYNLLGSFDVLGSGAVMTCIRGHSEFTVFLGYEVDPTVPAQVRIGDVSYHGVFDQEGGDVILTFEDTAKIYKALEESDVMIVTYTDLEKGRQTTEFDIFGFKAVTQGWEKLCTSPTS